MLKFLKDRIALIFLLIAGNSISLNTLIKADEIKSDCTNVSASISLLLSLIISLSVSYFLKKVQSRQLKMALILATMLIWITYVISVHNFIRVNDKLGKIPFPKNHSIKDPVDSTIVGGCQFTEPAQAEVDTFARSGMPLNYNDLFADFNYSVAAVWDVPNQACARTQIIWSFSMMIAFLVGGLTLATELLISKRPATSGKGKKSTAKKPSTGDASDHQKTS